MSVCSELGFPSSRFAVGLYRAEVYVDPPKAVDVKVNGETHLGALGFISGQTWIRYPCGVITVEVNESPPDMGNPRGVPSKVVVKVFKEYEPSVIKFLDGKTLTPFGQIGQLMDSLPQGTLVAYCEGTVSAPGVFECRFPDVNLVKQPVSTPATIQQTSTQATQSTTVKTASPAPTLGVTRTQSVPTITVASGGSESRPSTQPIWNPPEETVIPEGLQPKPLPPRVQQAQQQQGRRRRTDILMPKRIRYNVL